MSNPIDVEEREGLLLLTTATKFGRFGIKLSRNDIRELHEALTCCPGARVSTAHAVWHYRNRQMPRPCADPEQWGWHH